MTSELTHIIGIVKYGRIWGVRSFEFDTESELIAFLRGVYYTLVDYDTH